MYTQYVYICRETWMYILFNIFVHICIYIYICICIFYLYIYIFIYLFTYVCICLYLFVYIYTYVCVYFMLCSLVQCLHRPRSQMRHQPTPQMFSVSEHMFWRKPLILNQSGCEHFVSNVGALKHVVLEKKFPFIWVVFPHEILSC